MNDPFPAELNGPRVVRRTPPIEDVLDKLDVQHAGVTASGEIPFHCVVH